jgi:hypothetical protein
MFVLFRASYYLLVQHMFKYDFYPSIGYKQTALVWFRNEVGRNCVTIFGNIFSAETMQLQGVKFSDH